MAGTHWAWLAENGVLCMHRVVDGSGRVVGEELQRGHAEDRCKKCIGCAHAPAFSAGEREERRSERVRTKATPGERRVKGRSSEVEQPMSGPATECRTRETRVGHRRGFEYRGRSRHGGAV